MIVPNLFASRPSTCSIFNFVAGWDAFQTPLSYLNNTNRFTLGIGLYAYENSHGPLVPDVGLGVDQPSMTGLHRHAELHPLSPEASAGLQPALRVEMLTNKHMALIPQQLVWLLRALADQS